jgi:mono/diheme cytochrome c family protein
MMLMAMAALSASCVTGKQLPREQLTDPGALLFNGYTRGDVDCFTCHNGDGLGARGPGLTRRVPALSDEKFRKLVKEGGRWMPSFGDKVTDEDVTALLGWLRKTFPGN